MRLEQQGFSLLEILVAFAILALMLGVLLAIFGRATQTTIAAAQYTQAATLAESLLNRVSHDIALAPGVLSGETASGFSWELTLVELDLTEAFGTSELPVIPYRVDARVLWIDAGRPRQVTLSTLRLRLSQP
ncbi:type II secretion system protein [Caldichromatium japonicum]|uniref:Type II secretion system protein n=1 Tax=Caldichromatium japonicum TaxID=2699430 RepID=A0A6G7VEI5_9GAMM|nr:type II secretion system protein [Caldichromatium japonicum]QIK38320.1 type II secretion system protein [Caldichromatium japonicum]